MKIPKTIKIYGDILYKDKNCRSESSEQKEFFGWLKENRPAYYAVAIHPKNEGERSYKSASADKESGALNKGASDIIIPGNPSFVCEMKRKDHRFSKLSISQIKYLESAQSLSAFACIALGSDAAIQAIFDWEIKNNIAI